MSKKVNVRIAPSPTGYVHVGNTYTAYFNYIFAKQNKGNFILRLDDTDTSRHVDDAEQVIYDNWKWLDLTWDEGPDKGGKHKVYRQSERLDRYSQAANQLIKEGKAYQDDGATYLSIEEGPSVTFEDLVRGNVTFERENLKDFVIIKSNGYPTYQFATAVDEIDYEVTHVIRAEDHLSNTPIQILAIEALGGKPPIYAHLPLLRNEDKSKLSKRQGHVNLSWYQEKGFLPSALKNYFSLLGWTHPEQNEFFDEKEFAQLFSFEKVNTTAPIFDLQKLTWLNGLYIRELDTKSLMTKILDYLKEYEPSGYDQVNTDHKHLEKIVSLSQERLKTFDEFWPQSKFFYQEPQVDIDVVLAMFESKNTLHTFVNETIETLADKKLKWEEQALHDALDKTRETLNLKPKQAFMSLRHIVSGQKVTPPIFDTLAVLGRESVIARLENFLKLAHH